MKYSHETKFLCKFAKNNRQNRKVHNNKLLHTLPYLPLNWDWRKVANLYVIARFDECNGFASTFTQFLHLVLVNIWL